MKTSLILTVIVVMMNYSQCEKDSFDKKPPINFNKKYYQDWVGGQPGALGTLVVLIGKAPTDKIVFDSIYFRGRATKVSTEITDGQLTLSANFVKVNPGDSDLILSGDPKEEFGNKPPKVEPKIPFELSDNEVVVSYTVDNKQRYFRLKELTKEKTLYYP